MLRVKGIAETFKVEYAHSILTFICQVKINIGRSGYYTSYISASKLRLDHITIGSRNIH